MDSLSRYEDKIQKVIFDTADVIDLVPDDRIGGGHLHFDVFTHFEGNQKLIRNFIVDIMNNPELFMGPLGFDPLNAPPLAILSKEQQNMFVSALKKFDEGYIDIHELVKIIRDDVYRISFVAIDDVRPQRYYLSNQSKFQLLNLNNFPKTIELRGFRPQRNMVDQRALMEIFATRIAYLQQGNQLIDYHPQDLRGRITYTFDRLQDIHNYTLQHPSDRIAASFNRYLLETGMDPAKYHFLLPTNLQNLAKNPAINCVLNY